MKIWYLLGPDGSAEREHDGAVKRGVAWVIQRVRETPQPMILVPFKHDPDKRPLLAAATQAIRTETHRTLPNCGWNGGAVLAVWPTVKSLNELVKRHSPREVLVLQWSDATTEWLTKHAAILLP